jgi:hypothetical protein
MVLCQNLFQVPRRGVAVPVALALATRRVCHEDILRVDEMHRNLVELATLAQGCRVRTLFQDYR